MPRRAEIVVEGRVQGVYFRAFTQEAARQLGLGGYCRNLPDGRVEVVAEGDKKEVESLIERLRTGPPKAHVVRIQVEWKAVDDRFRDFQIRYD